MKRFASIFLFFIAFVGIISSTILTADAHSEELIDIDIYRAKCLAGITDGSADVSDIISCNYLYNYYVDDDVYSPTQSFLNDVYENKSLVSDYNAWMVYSMASEPSSALGLITTKVNYYEACVVSMYTKATINNNEFKNQVKLEVVNRSSDLLKSLCEIVGATETSKITEVIDIDHMSTVTYLQDCVKSTYCLDTSIKVCDIIDDAIEYGTDIIDVIDRVALYGEMVDLDSATKQWLTEMYSACDGSYDGALKEALFNLKTASTDYAGAALVDIKTAGFTLTQWVVGETLDKALDKFSALNPVTAAVCAGLKLGKLVSNMLFATDDVCEQLFVMNCIFDVQNLTRKLTEQCRIRFANSLNRNDAIAFNYSVDCYFESLINIDIDCMIELLDRLYNGGFVNKIKTGLFGAYKDYQAAVGELENLRRIRKQNYNAMNDHVEFALLTNFPKSFAYYYEGKDIKEPDGTVFVDSVSLEYTSYTLFINETVRNEATIYPSNATIQRVSYVTMNPEIAKIDAFGQIIPVKPGEVEIKALAANGKEDSCIVTILPFEASFDNSGYVIDKFIGQQDNVSIPDYVNGVPVTKIGNEAFQNTNVVSVTIPDTVLLIGSSTFLNCTKLTNLIIGDGVVSNIDKEMFSGCNNLMNIEIGDSVQSINDEAFKGLGNLRSVTLGKGIKFIGKSAFVCSILTDVYYTGTLAEWCGISFESASSNPLYSTKNLYIDGQLLTGDLMIPENVTSIGAYAFANCESISSVIVSDSVTIIDDYAFHSCSGLADVSIGDGVTSIGSAAFSHCKSLTSITIPDSITSIGESAFWYCTGLLELYMPISAKINDSSFGGCTQIQIITLTKGNGTAQNYKTLDSESTGYTYYYETPWYISGCSTVIIDEGVTNIGDCTFSYCSNLADVVISNSVISIGDYAFCGCTNIKQIYLPNSIQYVGAHAFASCAGLSGFAFNKGIVVIEDSTFENCNSLVNVYIPDSVTSIGDFAFCNCSGLTSITLPDSITSIGVSAFRGCTSLTSVKIGDSVTSIGEYAFRNCISITGSITIPDGVNCIGDGVFYNCSGINCVKISNNVTSIGEYAFFKCTGLKELKLPISATINDSSFEGCTNIAKITLTKGNGDIRYFDQDILGENFYQETPWYISKCPRVIIERGITAIGNSMFHNCNGLETIEIPDTITLIGENAFNGCYNLGIVWYSGTEDQWNDVSIEMGNVELDVSIIHTDVCRYTGMVVQEPTCTEEGVKRYTCLCGKTYCENLQVVDHTESDWEVETHPTATTTGKKIKKCTICEAILAEEIIPVLETINGTCGNNLLWTIDCATGTLTISGTGNMDIYKYASAAPWYQYSALIKNVIIEDGATTIGNSAFEGYTNLASITIPDSVTSIGEYTFYGCKAINVLTLGDGVKTIGMYAFGGCTGLAEVSFGKSISVINKNAFYGCSKIKTVNYNGTQEQWEKVTIEANNTPIINATKNFKAPEHTCEFGEWIVTVVPTTTKSGMKTHTCSICGAAETAELPSLSIETAEQVTISFNTGIVSGFDSGLSSLDSYITMNSTIYTLSYDSNNGKFGTGSKAILKDGDTIVAEYTILIYGDTTGDSWYDGQDAIIVDCLANGMLTKDDVGEAVYMAADCNHDGVIDQLDVEILNQAGTLLSNVDQSKPTEVLLETSAEYVEYLDLIDQSPEIEIEDETDAPEADVDTTPEQDAKVDIFEMILTFIKSIFEMLLSYIPMPLK